MATIEAPAQPKRKTLYRGDPGMWSWALHRITGVTVFFFLFVHVLDTALVRVSPETYDEAIEIYKTPIVALMEMGLVFCVLFHALNGVRVILVDFWSKGPRYQKQMLWGILGLLVVLLIPAIGRMFYLLLTEH
ncbi:succinate dehydrogenase, cytochrome b556 subunit [Nocardia sp. X0981]